MEVCIDGFVGRATDFIGQEFLRAMVTFAQEERKKTKEWIEELRFWGIKGAFVNDGYIDRDNGFIDPLYPTFNDGITIEDMVAIGTYNDYKIVTIVNIAKNRWVIPGYGLPEYKYQYEG